MTTLGIFFLNQIIENKKAKPQTPESTLCVEKEAIQDNNANGLMRNGI